MILETEDIGRYIIEIKRYYPRLFLEEYNEYHENVLNYECMINRMINGTDYTCKGCPLAFKTTSFGFGYTYCARGSYIGLR